MISYDLLIDGGILISVVSFFFACLERGSYFLFSRYVLMCFNWEFEIMRWS